MPTLALVMSLSALQIVVVAKEGYDAQREKSTLLQDHRDRISEHVCDVTWSQGGEHYEQCLVDRKVTHGP